MPGIRACAPRRFPAPPGPVEESMVPLGKCVPQPAGRRTLGRLGPRSPARPRPPCGSCRSGQANSASLIWRRVCVAHLGERLPVQVLFRQPGGGEGRRPSVPAAVARAAQAPRLAEPERGRVPPPRTRVLPSSCRCGPRADFHVWRAATCSLLPARLSPKVFLEVCDPKETDEAGILQRRHPNTLTTRGR